MSNINQRTEEVKVVNFDENPKMNPKKHYNQY